MAIRVSGVKLTLQGLKNFTAGLDHAQTAVKLFAQEAKTVSNTKFFIGEIASAISGPALTQAILGLATVITSILGPHGPVIVAIIAGVALAAKKALDITIAVVSKISGVIGAALRTIGNLVGGAFNIIGGVIKTALSPLNYFLGGLIRIAEYAAGGLLYRAVVETFNAIAGAITDAFDAISSFQLLRIRLTRLKAIDLFESGSVMSLAEGLKAAVKPAADLLYTLKKIAILTPFTTEDIANTFAFAKTMGVTDAQALLLTNTINDFVAGMGLWPETSQRIIINLEQMVRAGKVTGTELRDLARGAMLPLIDIFASMQKEVNMGGLSLDEFRKKVSAGEVSVNEFFKAFIDVVNKDFKGAAENASVTIEGVVNNFKDLIRSGLGDELFGPLAQRLTVFANSIIRGLLTEESFSALRTVGQSILQTFDYIAKTIQNNVIPVLRSFLLYLGIIKPEVDRAREGFKSFGDRFRDIAKLNNLQNIVKSIANFVFTVGYFISQGIEKIGGFLSQVYVKMVENFTRINSAAKSWGTGLGNAFAAGLRLAIKAIIGAITFIGNIIKYFMSPGSDPRFLAGLGEWAYDTGAYYAQMFSEGMRKLSFDIFGGEAFTNPITGNWGQEAINVFSDIAGTVQSFYNSLVNLTVGENDVTEMTLKMRNAIRDAITAITVNGQDLQQALSQAFGSMGHISPEAKEYIRLAIQMGQANQAVADAQAEINRITEQYDAILRPLEKRLSEIRGKATDLDDKREISRLNLVLIDPNATADEKERARLRIEELNIEKKIRDVEIQKENALTSPQELLRIAELNRDTLAAQVEYYKSIVEMQIENNNLLQNQWDIVNKLEKERQDELDRMAEALNNATDAAKELSAAFEGLDFPAPSIPEFNVEDWFNFDDALKDAKDQWGIFTDWWTTEITNKLQPEIKTISTLFSDLWGLIAGDDAISGPGAARGEKKSRIAQIIYDVRQAITDITKTWQDSGAQTTLDLIIDRVSKLFGGEGVDSKDSPIAKLSSVIQDLITWFGKPETQTGINNFFNTMEKIRGTLWPDTKSEDPQIRWGSYFGEVIDWVLKIGGALALFIVQISLVIAAIGLLPLAVLICFILMAGYITAWLLVIAKVVWDKWVEITDTFNTKLGEIVGVVWKKMGEITDTVLLELLNLAVLIWDPINTLATKFLLGLSLAWLYVFAKMEEIKNTITNTVSGINIWDPMNTLATKFLLGLSLAWLYVSTKMEEIKNTITNTLSGINLWSIGYNMIRGLYDGINWANTQLLQPLLNQIGWGVPQWFINYWQQNSPSKVFAEIGYNAGAGLAVGMASAAKDIMGASQLLSSSMMASGQLSAGLMYSPAMAGASNTTNYNLSVNSGLPPNVVAGSFAAMAVKARK